LYFSPIEPNDIVVHVSGLQLAMDARTARRANGLKIDFVEGASGPGFKLDNPNESSPIKGIHPVDLLRVLEAQETLQLIDVRHEVEHKKAKLEIARRLDPAYQAELDSMPKDARLVFLAHHSTGAQAAARQFYDRGFQNVWYVVGGMDAWATMDPDVPRY
jgi:monothiol glutaredoxin